MKKIQISATDLDWFRQIQGKERTDCIAAFTVAQGGPIWPFRSQGNTPEDFREIDVRGVFPALDQIADELMQQKGKTDGGRFFINSTGAFYRLGNGRADIRFVEFEIV
jgi:hypothetical protein